jgi:uncharacterized protein YtpQ (UPF0354 family)
MEKMKLRTQQSLRPGIALVVLLLNAGICHADDLTEKVLQAFRAQVSELRVTAKTDDELQVTGRKGAHTVYLFNLRTACASRKAGCDEAVSSFVQQVASIASAEQSASAFVAGKVYAVLRDAGFGGRSAEMIKAGKEPNKQLVVLPFIESIEVLFVVDGEKAVRYVSRDDMIGAGLTEKGLLDLATRNAARLPELKYQLVKGMDGLYFMPANDGLGTSRAFDLALWKKLEAAIGGPIAMSVPTRDWIIFTRAAQPENVAKMHALAGRIVRGEPYPISDAVLISDGNGWKTLQPQ